MARGTFSVCDEDIWYVIVVIDGELSDHFKSIVNFHLAKEMVDTVCQI